MFFSFQVLHAMLLECLPAFNSDGEAGRPRLWPEQPKSAVVGRAVERRNLEPGVFFVQ